MSEYKSSEYNSSKNSYNSAYLSNKLKKNNSLYLNSSKNKNSNKKYSYFDVYKQIKEEMKIDDSVKIPKKFNNKKRKKIIDQLYLKNTNQFDDYLKNNYSYVDLQGTKELDNIQQNHISTEVENNQLHWKNMIPGLKYRNPELNKNRQKLNYTPIPIYSNTSNMNEYQKNELKKAIDKAVFIRKTEYTHAFPPPISEQDKNQQYKTISMLQLINSAKIIQKWYRKIKNNKEFKNINKRIN